MCHLQTIHALLPAPVQTSVITLSTDNRYVNYRWQRGSRIFILSIYWTLSCVSILGELAINLERKKRLKKAVIRVSPIFSRVKIIIFQKWKSHSPNGRRVIDDLYSTNDFHTRVGERLFPTLIERIQFYESMQSLLSTGINYRLRLRSRQWVMGA